MSPFSLRLLRGLFGAAALAVLAGCAGAAPPAASPRGGGTEAYRIYDFEGNPVDGLPLLVEALGEADVVFVGEQHDDAVGHRFELDLLRELGGTRPVVVALEMFERDAQPALDAYLAGEISEAEFLERSRPWPNYTTDYRPLVEIARERGWRVVASNVPRPLAASVAREGLAALETLDPAERALAAVSVRCPEDAYYERFSAEMRGHAGAHGTDASGEMEAMIRRLYEAQCLKDETMAESILAAREGNPLTLHFNGAFHSDEGMGIVPRLQRRRGRLNVAIVSLVPAADPADAAAASGQRGRADFVVLTRDPGVPSRR